MNAMNDPATMMADHHELSSNGVFTLRRPGRKAVRFEGCQLIEAIGSDGSRAAWHDLNIYRTAKGSIITELTVRHSSPDIKDVIHVNTFADLSAAAAWLESYPAANDVPIPDGLGGNDVALPWAVLQAVQLRQTIEHLTADYDALLSEVFAALDLTDSPEVPAGAMPVRDAA